MTNSKKAFLLTVGAIITIVILNESGVLNALVGFLIAGAVPGTTYSVPSTLMLLFLISGIWVILFRLTAIEWLRAYIQKPVAPLTESRKKHTPKRRYSQV